VAEVVVLVPSSGAKPFPNILFREKRFKSVWNET
jgi:hypothetical protein